MTEYREPSPRVRVTHHPVVAVVDCDDRMRNAVVQLLSTGDLTTAAYASSRDFLKVCSNPDSEWPVADLLLCRLELESHAGLEFLRHLERWKLRIPTVVYSTGGEISTAVSSFRAGALDFIDHARPDACFRHRVRAALERAPTAPCRAPIPRPRFLPSTH